MYADDTKLMLNTTDLHCVSLLQQDIERLNRWCEMNELEINKAKTVHVMYATAKIAKTKYTIAGQDIERKGVYKDLGVIFDESLTFRENLASIISRTKQLYGFIYRKQKDIGSRDIIKTMYMAYVLPIIEYGSVVYNTNIDCDSTALEQIQKKFTRLMLGVRTWANDPNHISYPTRLSSLGMVSLHQRRVIASVKLVHKMLTEEDYLPSLKPELTVRIHRPTRTLRNKYKYSKQFL